MTRNDYPFILQMKDVTKILGFSKSTVYSLVQEPDFPVLQVNNRKVVYRDDFFAWLDSKRRVIS
ncbi:TPA: helix-turn-helix domain-containing protein [Bacillus cereus]|nr:helix-turn-helix domain-containing protein [Bacillus cereus]